MAGGGVWGVGFQRGGIITVLTYREWASKENWEALSGHIEKFLNTNFCQVSIRTVIHFTIQNVDYCFQRVSIEKLSCGVERAAKYFRGVLNGP